VDDNAVSQKAGDCSNGHISKVLNRSCCCCLCGLQHFSGLMPQERATGADDSRRVLSSQYQIPLTVVSYKELYGWTMDEIVREIGTKNNCTFCGVFRRQVLPSLPRVVPSDIRTWAKLSSAGWLMSQMSCV